jgi:hypothetical protein
MVQRRNCAGLALHSLSQFRVGGKMSRQNFHGYVTAEACVASEIDFSHAARAQRFLNFVWSEFGARG